MSPRKQEHNEHMRAAALSKIEKSALSIFAEYGYHGTTIKQIAVATGLSYGLVYHYFPSKEAIFRHLVDFALDGSIKAVSDTLDAPGTAWERLQALSSALVKNALTGESSLFFLIMMQAMTEGRCIPGLFAHIENRSAICYEKMIPVIVEAQKSGEAADGDPAVLASAFFSFVQGLSLLAFQKNEMTEKITPEILIRVLQRSQ